MGKWDKQRERGLFSKISKISRKSVSPVAFSKCFFFLAQSERTGVRERGEIKEMKNK